MESVIHTTVEGERGRTLNGQMKEGSVTGGFLCMQVKAFVDWLSLYINKYIQKK